MIPSSPGPGSRAGKPGPLPFPSSIRRILCPTDLSDESDTALAHAFLVAERFDAELTLFHSIDVRKVARTLGSGAPMTKALRRADAEAARHLEARARRTSARTCITVDYGLSPHQAVVAAIEAGRPDLTVMSTQGRRGIAHLVMGSVAETAIEKGGCRSRGFPSAGCRRPSPRQSRKRRRVVRFLQPEFRGLPVTARVELGPGWESIPSIAGEEGCDLIVMSTHRHDSLADAMLGSRAERIVTLAPCPVIVV